MSRKLIVNDGKRERELLLVGTMVVGRDPTCDISENDSLLSRRHVEFVAGARDVVVRDLGSRNGILINGVKTTQAILRGGDVIQVGHLQITFVDDGAAYAPAADTDADATVMAIPPAPHAPAAPSRPAYSPTVAISRAAADAPTVRTGVGPAPVPAAAADEFDKTVPTVRKPEVVEDPDKTHFVAPPAPPAPSKPPAPQKPSATPAPAAAAPAAGDDVEDPDKTRFVAPPTPAPRTTASAPPAVPRPAPAPVAARPPAGADEDSDKTRFVPPPAPKPAPVRAASAPVAAAAPPKAGKPVAPPPAARTQAAPEPAKAAEQATPRIARRPWTFFVLVQVATLAAVVFLATAIPLILWQQRVLNATASSRASALIGWLAADAKAALEGNRPGAIASAADDVAREPGVVSALVLSPEGRVLAPASRSTETIDRLPALAVKPGEVSRLQQAWNDGLVESARPVQSGDRPRAAIAWVTYRPSAPAEAGNGAVVLALPVIIVLVAAWFTSRLINRQTMKALTMLNEDIELAVGGRLDAIGDPLGAKPVKDLADAVNYLIAKTRTATGSEPSARPSAAGPKVATRQNQADGAAASAKPLTTTSSTSSQGVTRLEAHIVVNAQYRVTDASAGCAALIGVRPDALIGQHLVNAIPDKEIADAVMQTVSALGASGEHRALVEPGTRGYAVSVVVSREGKDKPLTITLAADREAGA